MNAQARSVVEPLYPAPLAYQAEAVLTQALSANTREYAAKRNALLNKYAEKAEAIRRDHLDMSAADFLRKYS